MNFQQALSDLSGKVQLDAAGLVALADLQSIAKWTAITGTSSLADILFWHPACTNIPQPLVLVAENYPQQEL